MGTGEGVPSGARTRCVPVRVAQDHPNCRKRAGARARVEHARRRALAALLPTAEDPDEETRRTLGLPDAAATRALLRSMSEALFGKPARAQADARKA